MIPLRRVRCLVFDFDGVLVDSNALKENAYFDVFRRFPKARPLIERVLRDVDGDRYDVIGGILRELVRDGLLRDTEAGEVALEEYAKQYNDICEEAVATAPEVPGGSAVLKSLVGVCPLYINSATPEEPLRRIVSRRAWTPFFKDVFGRPRTKVENLELILAREGIGPESLAFVGDGANDEAAARSCGCWFIGYMNASNRLRGVPTVAVTDLAQLPLAAGLV